MNQRDQELLNKQFRWLVAPPRTADLSIFTILAIVAMVVSASIGTIAIARQIHPAPIAADETKHSCLQFSKSENLPRLR